jgi:putative ABC transport system permease protein
MNNRRGTGVIQENLMIALDILWVHKLRSALIILGVSIGVASLMGMVSILLGLNAKITKDIRSSEQTVVQVQKFDFLVGGFDEAMLHRKDLTEEDAKAIRSECTTLQHVGYILQGSPHTLKAGNEKSRMISVAGTQPALLYIWNLDLETGRMFTDEEVFHRAKVVVIGHSPRRDLFPNSDPVGKTLRIGDDDYKVVGAFVERKTLFGDMGENFVLMPYTTYLATLWREFDNRTIFGAVRPGVSVEAAKDDVIRVMRLRRRLKASQENDFAVTSSDAALEFLQRITGPVAAVLAAISSIALIVGGIGVMNMMLVSVTERTGEIGIRKAVGATRQDILLQFLVEAGSLTGIGGILGITLGSGAALVISRLTGLPVSLSPFYVAIAVVASVLIGVFFGIYPANRASKLDPVAAMNYAKN